MSGPGAPSSLFLQPRFTHLFCEPRQWGDDSVSWRDEENYWRNYKIGVAVLFVSSLHVVSLFENVYSLALPWSVSSQTSVQVHLIHTSYIVDLNICRDPFTSEIQKVD